VIEDEGIPPALKEIISSLQTLLANNNEEINASNEKLAKLSEG